MCHNDTFENQWICVRNISHSIQRWFGKSKLIKVKLTRIRAIPCKPRPILCMSAQSKSSDLPHTIVGDRGKCLAHFGASRSKKILNRSFFIEVLLEALEKSLLRDTILDTSKNRQSSSRLSWNFLYMNTRLYSIHTISLSSHDWAVSVLWDTRYEEKPTFWPTLAAHISRLEDDRDLKVRTQTHLDAT